MSDISNTHPSPGDTQPSPGDTQPSLGDTQPSLVDTQPKPVEKSRRRASGLFAILGFVILLVLGIFGGVGSGMAVRKGAEETLIGQQLQDQFNRGVQAMDAGQYEVARQHFEFVINHDSNYPGAQEAYTQLLLQMRMSPTPTLTPTSTLTATPDLRGADQIYKSIQALLSAKPQSAQDWDAVIASLDSLRKIDPTYRVAEVDGMYYLALRNRGVSKINAATCQEINLEGGIYDLTLAEQFGPLDATADGLRNSARAYIAGASYWELDWVQAQYWFGQVMSAFPNLIDSFCKSATERWRYATVKVAEQLIAKGDFCGAQQQYDAAFQVDSPENATAFPTATEVYNKCHPPAPPPPAATPTGSGTPAEIPSETPTPTP